jgi:hypothetical protein
MTDRFQGTGAMLAGDDHGLLHHRHSNGALDAQERRAHGH